MKLNDIIHLGSGDTLEVYLRDSYLLWLLLFAGVTIHNSFWVLHNLTRL
jgi:hypothetical protein